MFPVRTFMTGFLLAAALASAPAGGATTSEALQAYWDAGYSGKMGLQTATRRVVSDDPRMFLADRPLYVTGVNCYNLFVQCHENDSMNTTLMEQTVAALAANEVPIVRFSCSPYYSSQIHYYTEQKTKYLANLAHLADLCDANKILLIPSVFWNTACLPEYFSEDIEKWGDTASETYQFMVQYTADIVNTLKDHKCIAAWEFGNEFNLKADIGIAGHPQISAAQEGVALAGFAATVSANDSAGRMICTGHSVMRNSQWHQYSEQNWNTDSFSQYVTITGILTPAPITGMSEHVYEDKRSFSDLGANLDRTQQVAYAQQCAARNGQVYYVGEFTGPGSTSDFETIENHYRVYLDRKVQLSLIWNYALDGSVEHSFSAGTAAGQATFALMKSYNAQLAQVTESNLPTYYVAPTGNDSADGLSWATAKKTIATAVEVAQAGNEVSLVLVSNGTYQVSTAAQCLSLTNAVTVRGFGASRDDVVVWMTGPASTRVATLSHAKACLQHLTFKGNKRTESTHTSGPHILAGLMTDCVVTEFEGTNGTVGEGAVCLVDGRVENSLIYNNHMWAQTGHPGGGIYMSGGIVSNCVIRNNSCMGTSAGGGGRIGGGVYLAGGLLTHSLIAKNLHRIRGTGVGINDTARVEYCTIVDNYDNLPTETPSAIARCTGSPTLEKCVIVRNWNWKYPVANADNDSSTKACTFTDCCVAGQTDLTGSGNIDATPVFADPDNDDYSLGAGDWEGMGYRPLDTSAFRVGFTVATDGAADSSVVTLTALARGASGAVTYDWTVKDETGAVVRQGAGETFAPTLSAGLYTVTLAATAGGDEASFTAKGCVRVRQSELEITPDGSVSLPEAIEKVADYGTLWLADGTYKPQEPIYVDRPIRIISRNGPNKTSIWSNPNTTFENICHPKFSIFFHADGASLCGLHLRYAYSNGSSIQGGIGIVRIYDGGLVSNCVLHALDSYRSSGSACEISVKGAVVDSVMRNGTVTPSGNTSDNRGVGFRLSGADCLADRCVVSNNVYKNTGNNSTIYGGGIFNSLGTVRNCLVVGNRHQNGGGGIGTSGGTVENCTVIGNSFIYGSGAIGHGGIHAADGAVVRNCIVRDNFDNQTTPVASDLGALAGTTVSNCNFPTASSSVLGTATDNIDADPLFVGARDWHLQKRKSPCINKGAKLDWAATGLDLDRRPRESRGTPPDLGCYEVQFPGTILFLK